MRIWYCENSEKRDAGFGVARRFRPIKDSTQIEIGPLCPLLGKQDLSDED